MSTQNIKAHLQTSLTQKYIQEASDSFSVNTAKEHQKQLIGLKIRVAVVELLNSNKTSKALCLEQSPLDILIKENIGKSIDIIEDNQGYELSNEMFGQNWEINHKNFVLSNKKFSFIKKVKIATSSYCHYRITFDKVTTTYPYHEDTEQVVRCENKYKKNIPIF